MDIIWSRHVEVCPAYADNLLQPSSAFRKYPKKGPTCNCDRLGTCDSCISMGRKIRNDKHGKNRPRSYARLSKLGLSGSKSLSLQRVASGIHIDSLNESRESADKPATVAGSQYVESIREESLEPELSPSSLPEKLPSSGNDHGREKFMTVKSLGRIHSYTLSSTSVTENYGKVDSQGALHDESNGRLLLADGSPPPKHPSGPRPPTEPITISMDSKRASSSPSVTIYPGNTINSNLLLPGDSKKIMSSPVSETPSRTVSPAMPPTESCSTCADTSGSTIVMDHTYSYPIDAMFSLLFGNGPQQDGIPFKNTFIGKILVGPVRKCSNVTLSNWHVPDPSSPEPKLHHSTHSFPPILTISQIESGLSRKFEYTMQIANPLSPSTRCLVSEEVSNVTRDFCCVMTTTRTPEAPSGTCFHTVVYTCLSRVVVDGNESTRVLVRYQVVFTKSSWLRVAIERGAGDGIKGSYVELQDLLTKYLANIADGTQQYGKPELKSVEMKAVPKELPKRRKKSKKRTGNQEKAVPVSTTSAVAKSPKTSALLIDLANPLLLVLVMNIVLLLAVNFILLWRLGGIVNLQDQRIEVLSAILQRKL